TLFEARPQARFRFPPCAAAGPSGSAPEALWGRQRHGPAPSAGSPRLGQRPSQACAAEGLEHHSGRSHSVGQLLLNLVVTLAWIVVTEAYPPSTVVLGFGVGALLAWLSARASGQRFYLSAVGGVIWFILR